MKMRFAMVGLKDLENVRYNLKVVSPGRPNPTGTVHPQSLNGVDMSLYDPDNDMTFQTWIDIIEGKGFDKTHPDIIDTQKRIDEVDEHIDSLRNVINEMADNGLKHLDEYSREALRPLVISSIEIPVLIKDFTID